MIKTWQKVLLKQVKKIAPSVMKNTELALEVGAENSSTAAYRNPAAVSSAITHEKKISHTGKDLNLH